MLPHLVLIKQAVLHTQVLWQIAKRPQVAAGGLSAAGRVRYGSDIVSGGTNYSAVDSPGRLLSRGNCQQRDRPMKIVSVPL